MVRVEVSRGGSKNNGGLNLTKYGSESLTKPCALWVATFMKDECAVGKSEEVNMVWGDFKLS